MTKLIRNKLFGGAAIGLIITLLIGAISAGFGSAFQNWHLRLADTLYTYENPSDDIVIIAIDDKSTEAIPLGLGRFTQWERDNYANLLTALENDKPAVVAFDLLFNNPGLRNEPDDQFAAAIEQAGNVVLEFAADEQSAIFPQEKFAENATLGLVWGSPDVDGVYRDIPIHYEKYDSLSLAAVKAFKDKEADLPTTDEKLKINYFANPFGYQMVSFIDVIDGNVPPGTFKDKLVFVGLVSFKEIQDTALTPRSNEIPMPGVEIHANVAQTILDGKFLSQQGRISELIMIALISIALTIAFNYLGIIFSVLLALAAVFGYIFAAQFAFRRGLILNMLTPFAAILFSYLFAWVYRYFVADKNKREMKSAFGHYVSDQLVEEISKNPEMVKLGGEKKIVTVFFTDIKDSTKISEQRDIESWVAQLNEYFTVMENVVKQLGGTLDKYEGDAIMGFWNAPVSQKDHMLLAYSAAMEMKKALKFLHQKWEKQGKPLLEFRMGINTGEAIVGNFGSESRFDYTVMGDVVNTASRLESSANKAYGTSIMIDGVKYADIEKLSTIVARKIDTVLLPGKNEPVGIFELICLRKDVTPEINETVKTYATGLAAYNRKEWGIAIEAFKSLKNDPPSQVMLERCEKLQKGEQVSGLDEKMIFRIANK